MQRYRLRHPKRTKKSQRKYMKEYYQRPEVKKQMVKNAQKRAKNHPEKRRETERKHQKKYRLKHPEHWRNWAKQHPESIRKYRQLHPEYDKKRNAKRRKLGFIPLNEPFDGSVTHHIDFIIVVYIPRELHKSTRHNIWTGQGMAEINTKAFEWLERNGEYGQIHQTFIKNCENIECEHEIEERNFR